MTDRDLIRHYWPVELRPAYDALFAIDDVMAEVVASSTQPALGAIRLAWWREALERLDHTPPPAEPRLQAAAELLLPCGVTGTQLAALEDGWATLLDETTSMERVASRGERLFAIAGKLLGADESGLGEAGRFYGGVDVARRGYIDLVKGDLALGKSPFPRAARPVTALAALAFRDLKRGGPPFEPEATPGRAMTLIRHRLSGVVG